MPSIPNYREILRLTSEGRSQRQIESSVHSSHQTISEVQKTAREKHIQWPLDESVTNEMLRDILFSGQIHCSSNSSGAGLSPDPHRACKAEHQSDSALERILRPLHCSRENAVYVLPVL